MNEREREWSMDERERIGADGSAHRKSAQHARPQQRACAQHVMIHSRTSHWVNLEYSIYLGKFRTDITKYLEEINLDKFRYIQIYLEYNKLI